MLFMICYTLLHCYNMKSKHLHYLSELELDYLELRYPSVNKNYLPLTKWSDTTSNGLEKCIVRFLQLSGYQAERIKNMGRYIDGKKTFKDVLGYTRTIGSGTYIPGTSTNGTSDISATVKGRSVKIEVKIGKDKQSEAQKKYQEDIESSGGQYWIAKDFDSFYEQYQKFLLIL